MATTREQMAADRDAFDDEFDQEHAAPRQPTEDEVFGLVDDEQDAAKGQAGIQAGDAATPNPAKEAAATSTTPPTPENQDAATQSGANEQEQKLQEWEARLQQRQAELDAHAAAMQTSNVNQQQHSDASHVSDEDHASEGHELDEGEDPIPRLIEDFGPDFVELVKKLVAQECKTAMAGCMDDRIENFASKVDQLIAELAQDRQQNHFKAIAASHADFMDVVASPEFNAWKEVQPATDQPDIARVIESGSAQEIIDLLTRFKQSKSASSEPTDATTTQKSASDPDIALEDTDDFPNEADEADEDFDDAALDAAEGVRSGGGLKLPKAPPASDDYSAAWDEF